MKTVFICTSDAHTYLVGGETCFHSDVWRLTLGMSYRYAYIPTIAEFMNLSRDFIHYIGCCYGDGVDVIRMTL